VRVPPPGRDGGASELKFVAQKEFETLTKRKSGPSRRLRLAGIGLGHATWHLYRNLVPH
jgi:hypothetical protein